MHTDATARRRAVVGVMGSGEHEHAALAEPAGRLIARAGHHLLTGGGRGVMAAVARAFTAVAEREGLSIGVVRADGDDHLGEANCSRPYRARGPNPWVEVPILTHLPASGRRGKDALSRNHINVLSSTLVLVLPGGDGTQSELELALEYGRPVALFLGDERLGGSTAAELARRHAGRPTVVASEHELERLLRTIAAGR